MPEQGEVNHEINFERRMETIQTNVGMMLRRCRRKNWQIRDYLLRTLETRRPDQDIDPEVLQTTTVRIEAIPDVDWTKSDGSELVSNILNALEPIVAVQYQSGQEWYQERDPEWGEAGVLQYSEEPFDEKEESDVTALRLHVPPSMKQYSPKELRNSLREIGLVLQAHPNIHEIRYKSLLLEHPLLQRLGFTIDPRMDDGEIPAGQMPRSEFLQRYGNGNEETLGNIT